MYCLNTFYIGILNYICYQVSKLEEVSIWMACCVLSAGQGGLCQSTFCGHLAQCLTGMKNIWHLNIWVLPLEICSVTSKESNWWWLLFEGFSWLFRYTMEEVDYQGQSSDIIQNSVGILAKKGKLECGTDDLWGWRHFWLHFVLDGAQVWQTSFPDRRHCCNTTEKWERCE